jgi:hypothetical protein
LRLEIEKTDTLTDAKIELEETFRLTTLKHEKLKKDIE